jgi:suppressor of fused protein SUFU
MSHPDLSAPRNPDFDANAIAEHVIKQIGPITNVFYEVHPDIVQIDLLVVGPHQGRPYATIITCGMSERPMRVPIEDPDDLGRVPELRFAELLLCLPPDWPLSAEAFQQEENYWPVRWLKRLARLPHQHDGWLGVGHTIPNGDPARPFAANSQFCCWMIDQPILFPKEVQKLRVSDRATNLYSAVPLYEDEMQFKLRKGGAALAQLLDRGKVTELIDPSRTVCGL